MGEPDKNLREKVKLEKRRILACLQETELFQNVPEADLLLLTETCESILVQKGGYIYRRGSLPTHLIIIYSGTAFVYIGFDGSEELLAKVRRRGDYLGEMGVLGNEPNPCNVVAQENVIALLLPRAVFMEVMWRNHQITELLFKELVERIDMSSRKLINTIYMDAEGKLAYTLCRLIANGHQGKEEPCITISQQNLALASGMARQTVVKILTEWKGRGWITTKRNRIYVKDKEAIMEAVILSELK